MRKFNILTTSIALALASQVVVAAEIDLLNLASRSVDDTTLGDHVIVKQTTDGTTKYVTGNNGAEGQILAPVNMPMESEVRMKVWLAYSPGNWPSVSLFLLADEYQIKLALSPLAGDRSYLTGNALVTTTNDASGAWIEGYNTIRLALTNGEAKVYVNDVFSQKAKLVNANLVFNQLKLNSIDPSDPSVKIYELKAGGNVTTAASCSGSSTTTTPVSGTTNTGDLPQISSNLDIKIPRGLYSQANTIFTPAQPIPVWADLKYNAGGNYWTLSGAGVLPK